MASGGAPESGAQKNFDAVSHIQANRRQERSPRELLTLVAAALRLSRQASPRLASLNLGLQVVSVLLLVAQVVFAKLALEQILTESQAGDGSFGAVIPSLIGLVAATGFAGLAQAAQGHLQRLLGETVQQTMITRILNVTTTVPLEQFESPEFHDDLQRVRVNSVLQPLALSQGLQLQQGLLHQALVGICQLLSRRRSCRVTALLQQLRHKGHRQQRQRLPRLLL